MDCLHHSNFLIFFPAFLMGRIWEEICAIRFSCEGPYIPNLCTNIIHANISSFTVHSPYLVSTETGPDCILIAPRQNSPVDGITISLSFSDLTSSGWIFSTNNFPTPWFPRRWLLSSSVTSVRLEDFLVCCLGPHF